MKPAFNNVILDLDGTLTDSAEGVYNAIGYALKEIGREVPRSQLRFMLGPPIIEGFTQLLGGDRALAMKCVSIERVYSNARGIYEGRVFPEVHDMLEKLKAAGCRLAVATCRTMPSTVKVLAHYGLNGYFDAVEAPSQQDLNFRGKAGLIESILRRFGAKPGECLMAGDRAGDIDGAHDAGVRAAGALYGYGSREELSRADYLCQTPDDIMRLALCGRM